VATGGAISLGGIRTHEPIANIECGIVAESIKLPRCGKRRPIRPVLIERGQNILPGKVAKPVGAVLTGTILEVKKLSATLTLEKFHRMAFVFFTDLIMILLRVMRLDSLKPFSPSRAPSRHCAAPTVSAMVAPRAPSGFSAPIVVSLAV
jgi:hypothetical protein